MIAIAHDHGLDVPLRPILEVHTVVVRGLGLLPSVEGFVEDQHAEAIADVE